MLLKKSYFEIRSQYLIKSLINFISTQFVSPKKWSGKAQWKAFVSISAYTFVLLQHTLLPFMAALPLPVLHFVPKEQNPWSLFWRWISRS